MVFLNITLDFLAGQANHGIVEPVELVLTSLRTFFNSGELEVHLTWGSVSKHWRMDRRVTLPDLAHLRSSVRQGLRAIFWHRIRDWSKFVGKLVIKALWFLNFDMPVPYINGDKMQFFVQKSNAGYLAKREKLPGSAVQRARAA